MVVMLVMVVDVTVVVIVVVFFSTLGPTLYMSSETRVSQGLTQSSCTTGCRGCVLRYIAAMLQHLYTLCTCLPSGEQTFLATQCVSETQPEPVMPLLQFLQKPEVPPGEEQSDDHEHRQIDVLFIYVALSGVNPPHGFLYQLETGFSQSLKRGAPCSTGGGYRPPPKAPHLASGGVEPREMEIIKQSVDSIV